MATDSTDVRGNRHYSRIGRLDRNPNSERSLATATKDLYNLARTINSIKATTVVELEAPFAGYLKAEYPDIRKQTALRTKPVIRFLEQFHRAEALDEKDRLGYVMDSQLNITLQVDEKPYSPSRHAEFFG